MNSKPFNLFNLINSYDERVFILVKSFGCVDYNECVNEMNICNRIAEIDRRITEIDREITEIDRELEESDRRISDILN